jgi:hypothetical protein
VAETDVQGEMVHYPILKTDHMSRFVITPIRSKHRTPRSWRSLWIGCCVILLAGQTGCTTFFGKNYSDAEKIDLTPIKKEGYTVGANGVMQPLPATDESPSFILEVNHGKRSFERVPLMPGQPMFVADLMRDADFYRKIGKVRVTILRPNGANNPPVRLDVDFDPSGKRVIEGMNYSLRPGDHVVVSADDRGFLSQVMAGSVFGKPSK